MAQRVDGGFRAWLVVLGSFLSFFAGFGIVNSFGTFQSIYEEQWVGTSPSAISWIGALQLFFIFLGGPAVGPLFDKYGARWLMLSGTLLCAVSFIASSFCHSFIQFVLAQGVLLGIRNAFLYYPPAGAIAGWFIDRRSLALGLALAGASAGGIAWPILINRLFLVFTTPMVHRVLAAICIPILLVSCYLIQERRDPISDASEPEKEEGPATPTTNTSGSESELSTPNDIVGAFPTSTTALVDARPPTPVDTPISSVIATPKPSGIHKFKKAIVEKTFLTTCLALFCIYGGMLIPFNWIPSFAMENGISEDMANNLLSIGYAGSFIGRVASGWLADRFGRFYVLFGVACLTGVMTFCCLRMTHLALMVLFALLFGFGTGGLMPLGSACAAELARDTDDVGMRIGAMMGLSALAALGGVPLSGILKDASHSWTPPFVFSGALTTTGAVILLGVQVFMRR